MKRRSFFSSRAGKSLLFGIVGVTVIFFIPSIVVSPFRTFFGTASLPFHNVLSFAAYHTRSIGSFFTSVGNLKQNYERVSAENLVLRGKNAALSEVERENEFLRRELGVLPRERFRLAASEVIAIDSTSSGTMIVNIGEEQGVRKGMAVVSGPGVLVGRIVETTTLSSSVLPLSNPKSVVNAVETATEAKGVVRGEYGTGLLFDMVLESDTVREGDDVVSSGLGGDIPRGLFIGNVTRIEPSSDRLFQKATLASPLRYDRLRFVFVVLDERR